ncbi:MAG TPA: hypothetical protein QGH10_20080, partial [Armatimonadota bacterium]|nr:hypothetical protein [Armatimonadota bacterium]
PQAELHHADVRTFSLGRRFDVVTCMFDSLNYLTDPPDLALALAGLDTHLAERGSLVFDVNTYEGLEDAWQRTQAIDDVHHTLTIEMSFDATTALGRGLISGTVRDGGACCQFEEEHVERGYRAEEIEAMLDDLGLSFTKYDGDTLEPPGERPGRLLYVCRHEEERRCD